MCRIAILLFALAAAVSASAQYVSQTALRIRSYPSTPATCAAGSIFTVSTSAYICYTANTPTAIGGSGTFAALSGDATSTSTGGATTVTGINGVSLAGLASGFLYNTTVTGHPSIATASQLNALIETLTGCSTSSYVYTPAGADCVAQSGSSLPSGVKGQSVVNSGGSATTYTAQSPTIGVANGGAAITGSYTLACDSATVATGVQDRGTVAIVGSGGSVTIPDLAGTGCSGFFGMIQNSTNGSITVSRQTSDTFNVYGPTQGAPSTGQTSFSLPAGSWVNFTPNAISSTAYDVRIGTPPALASQYKTWQQPDGIISNAALPTSGFPASSFGLNQSGATWTITAIKCAVDSGSSTTVALTDGSGNNLLSGSTCTCSSSWAACTQSGTYTTIASGGSMKATYTPDGTAKSVSLVVSGTY